MQNVSVDSSIGRRIRSGYFGLKVFGRYSTRSGTVTILCSNAEPTRLRYSSLELRHRKELGSYCGAMKESCEVYICGLTIKQ